MTSRKAVFLDRDGTLIRAIPRPNFVCGVTAPFAVSELEFVPDVREISALFASMGFLRIMVTNQPDVQLGYLEPAEWTKIQALVTEHISLDDVLMCRHPKPIKCPMRKPAPGMLLAAACKWDIDPAQSYMIGDMESDVQAGTAAGCRTILIRQPYNVGVSADIVVDSLAQAFHAVRGAK